MRFRLILFLTVTLSCGTIGFPQTPRNPELAGEIDRLYAIDQQVQADLVSAYQNSASKEKIAELDLQVKETFRNQIPLLKKIIQKHGFPTFDLVGKEMSNNFFTMVQHSDSDLKFQQSALKLIKKHVKTNQVNTRNFAYLTDRVNINLKKAQIYGTQIEYDKSGNAVPKTMQNPETVNERRKSVGLERIEDYLEKMSELHKKLNTKN